jgi:hypothetical protein
MKLFFYFFFLLKITNLFYKEDEGIIGTLENGIKEDSIVVNQRSFNTDSYAVLEKPPYDPGYHTVLDESDSISISFPVLYNLSSANVRIYAQFEEYLPTNYTIPIHNGRNYIRIPKSDLLENFFPSPNKEYILEVTYPPNEKYGNRFYFY